MVTDEDVLTPVGQVALQRLSDLTPEAFDSVLFWSEAYRAQNQEDEAWMMYSYIFHQVCREQQEGE